MMDKMLKICEKKSVWVILLIIGIAIIPINMRYVTSKDPETIFEITARGDSNEMINDDEIVEQIKVKTGCENVAVGNYTVILQLEESVRVLYFDEKVELGCMFAENVTPTQMEFRVWENGVESQRKTIRYVDYYEAVNEVNKVLMIISLGLISSSGFFLLINFSNYIIAKKNNKEK